MTSWNSKTVKDSLAMRAKRLGVRMPQANESSI
jgi:hypothetical protein